jgi:hypothetical protein
VTLPKPAVGLVVNFKFLWPQDDAKRRTNAGKARPCLILFCAALDNERFRVAVVPITHTPQERSVGIEIPPAYFEEAGLDGRQQFVVSNELNEFCWPSRDVVAVLAHRPETAISGRLPPHLCSQIQASFRAERANNNTRSVDRAGAPSR